MAFDGLRDFITHLETNNDLTRVVCPVNPVLEISEIADRMVKSNGKALLFENTGTAFPLLINAFASERRISAAIGRPSPGDVSHELQSLFDSMGGKKSLFDKLSGLPEMISLLRLTPRKKSGRGRCQEIIVEKPDLSILPVLKCWPYDGGRFITLPLVHTRHPETEKTNLGMYRMQVMSPDSTGMHWHRHKTGARHYQAWRKKQGRMPVTVTLGGDPVYTYASTAPLPENIDEYLLAGFLRKKRVELVRCLTNDLWVPSDSDIVIEGFVDTSEETVTEGPFGDHTGFYSLEDKYPLFHVTCITHRRNAVYPATIVGVPPMEDAWIGMATEKIFLAPLKMAIAPEITDIHMPVAGVAHNLVLAGIDKTYPGQGMKILNALFGAGQMMFSKYIIVLDGNIPLNDYHRVARAVFENVRFSKDLLLMHGPLDVLDHSSDMFSSGGKMGIDATVKMPEEKNAEVNAFRAVDNVTEISHNCVTGIKTLSDMSLPLILLSVRKPAEGLDMKSLVDQLPPSLGEEGVVTVAVDHGAVTDDLMMTAWLALGNTDPSRDFYPLGKGGIFIDATSKSFSLPFFSRRWPNVVSSDRETVELVDRRWDEYQTGDFVPSPSAKLAGLLQPGDAAVDNKLVKR